jgi:Zn-dependent protease with chaperone function
VLYLVPEKKEVELFDGWIPSDLITVAADDPRLHRLEAITDRLASHWPETGYDFRVEINDSADINAFAFPGGLIVVTGGLLDEVETENELALVLGHELGHFKNRDHLRGLGRGVALGIMLAVATGASDGGSLGATLAEVTLSSFSRRQELAADGFGLGVVHRQYGHIAGALGLYDRLGKDSGEERGLSSYFATHPSPPDRVARLRQQGRENGWTERGSVTAIDW